MLQHVFILRAFHCCCFFFFGGGFLLRGGAWRGWRDGFFSRTRSLTALQRFQLSVLADARKLHNPPTTTTTPLVGFAFYAERERERERWKSGAERLEREQLQHKWHGESAARELQRCAWEQCWKCVNEKLLKMLLFGHFIPVLCSECTADVSASCTVGEKKENANN